MAGEGVRLEWLNAAIKSKWRAFLCENGLTYEGDAERCIVARDEDTIIATASLDGDVVKYVAVDPLYRVSGVAAKVISTLLEDAAMRGKRHLFLFTSSDKAETFENLGFSRILDYEHVALMEWGFSKIGSYAKALEKHRAPGSNGAIIMNLNPFTVGHRYLIEQAAKRVDRLHVFLVKEEKSLFPYKARLYMAQEGTKDIPNVFLHPGSEYVLSHITFPSYFIKEAGAKSRWQAGLDISVFREYIVPALTIKKRFVGCEPFDKATEAYNQKMKELLEPCGCEIVEFDRYKSGSEYVSASRVRERLRQGEIPRELLPETTVRFLLSDEGQRIIGRLMKNGD